MNIAFINLRDLGGLPSRDGRTLTRGRLFRAGRPHTKGTEMPFPGNLKLIVDLRYAAERDLNPVLWPSGFNGRTVSHSHERHAEAPHVQAEQLGGGRAGIRAFYHNMYATLPLTAPYQNLFAIALQNMPSHRASTLIHCTAGKDRTGMLVALTLHALGIEPDAILADFMATRTAAGMDLLRDELVTRSDQASGRLFSDEAIDELLAIRPEYLDMMFGAIARDHGSIDGFLDQLGLTAESRAAWRDAVLD